MCQNRCLIFILHPSLFTIPYTLYMIPEMFSLMPLYILPIPSLIYVYDITMSILIQFTSHIVLICLQVRSWQLCHQGAIVVSYQEKKGAIIATLYFLGKIMILFRINLGHLSVLVKQLVPTWHFDNVQGDQIAFCSGYLSGSFSYSCRYKIEDLGFRLMMMFHMIGRM